MGTVKILITSDLHLGMERVNPLISRDERLNTLKKIGSIAREHDILLMAGDIINNGLIDREHINTINDEFQKISGAGTEIYLAAGEGEMEKQGSAHDALAEIRTDFTFTDESREKTVKSDKGDIFIYGRQSGDRAISADITRKEKNGFHIGLFHADFSPQSTEKGIVNCIGKKEIKQMNLDFFALGKSHCFRVFRFSERILGAYPGSPEPCSLDECGERFVVSFEIEENKITSFRRIPVNTVTVNSHEIECTTLKSENELIQSIKNSGSRETMNRIELTGHRDFTTGPVLKEELTGYFRGLKVIDRTDLSQRVFLEESASAGGFRGLFFRNLSQNLKSNPRITPDYNMMKDLLSGTGSETGGILFCDS